MRKRIMILILAVTLCTSSVVASEVRAEAAATTTVTAIGIAKAIMVLLSIAGVGIACGTIFDKGPVSEDTVSGFTNWLNNRDPEYYTAFMLCASSIAAGRLINTLYPHVYKKLKEYAAEYFGTETGVLTSVGTVKTVVPPLAAGDTLYCSVSYQNNGGCSYTISFDRDMYVIAVGNTYNSVYIRPLYVFYVPVDYVGDSETLANCFTFKKDFETDYSCQGPQVKQVSATSGYVVRWYNAYRSPIEFYSIDRDYSYLGDQPTGTSEFAIYTMLDSIISRIRAGEGLTESTPLSGTPLVGVGGIPATSVDSMVIGAGQTLTRDDNGDVVVEGGLTFGLDGVDIDTLLKGLAEGTLTYEQAMAMLGIAAVNTQEKTLEEMQEIAATLNPAVTGTGAITGNYTVSLTDLFPFCIPFDLYSIVKCFKADPVAPSAMITIPVGYDGNNFTWEEYEITLQAFSPVAAVVRVLEYIAFVIGLMLVTRKLIEG